MRVEAARMVGREQSLAAAHAADRRAGLVAARARAVLGRRGSCWRVLSASLLCPNHHQPLSVCCLVQQQPGPRRRRTQGLGGVSQKPSCSGLWALLLSSSVITQDYRVITEKQFVKLHSLP